MQIALVLKHGLLLLQIIYSKARTGKNERKIFFCTFSSEWGITQHKLISPLLGKLGINTLSCWNPSGLHRALHNKALGINTYRRGKTFQTWAYWGLHTGHSDNSNTKKILLLDMVKQVFTTSSSKHETSDETGFHDNWTDYQTKANGWFLTVQQTAN